MINEFIDKFISNKKFFKLNKNLNNFTKLSVSAKIKNTDTEVNTYGIDMNSHIKSTLLTELSMSIQKLIIRELQYEDNYLDFREFGIQSMVEIDSSLGCLKAVSNFLSNHDYQFCISNAIVAAILHDCAEFSPSINKGVNNSGGFYESGTINNCLVFVDPYLSVTDNKLILFNTIEYNIKDIQIENNNDEMLIYIYFATKIHKSSLTRLIYNEKSTGFSDFISKKRSDDINYIIS